MSVSVSQRDQHSPEDSTVCYLFFFLIFFLICLLSYNSQFPTLVSTPLPLSFGFDFSSSMEISLIFVDSAMRKEIYVLI